MSGEKKNLRKKIDEMSDKELDKVAGGFLFELSQSQIEAAEIIDNTGICPKCNQKVFYALDKMNAILKHVKQCYK